MVARSGETGLGRERPEVDVMTYTRTERCSVLCRTRRIQDHDITEGVVPFRAGAREVLIDVGSVASRGRQEPVPLCSRR